MVDNIKHTLELLARETKPAGRSLLIRKLTAEYARRSGDAPSETERRLFSTLVLDLYDQIDLVARRDIITLLARTNHITVKLADRLSHEQDELCTILFEHSPVLEDEQLLTAIRARSEAVLNAVARRQQVPETLVDALMARAFVSVTCELLSNHGAHFSANAMVLSTIICRNSLEIQSRFAARCLSDAAFHQKVVAQIEKGCPFMPERLARAAKDGDLQRLVGEVRGEIDEFVFDGAALHREEVVAQINLGELSFDSLLSTLIRNKRKEDIIWFLKDARGLSEKAVEHLLLSNGNRTLMRLLIEQEVSLKTFETLLRWRTDTLGQSDRHVRKDIESYRQLQKLTQLSA